MLFRLSLQLERLLQWFSSFKLNTMSLYGQNPSDSYYPFSEASIMLRSICVLDDTGENHRTPTRYNSNDSYHTSIKS